MRTDPSDRAQPSVPADGDAPSPTLSGVNAVRGDGTERDFASNEAAWAWLDEEAGFGPLDASEGQWLVCAPAPAPGSGFVYHAVREGGEAHALDMGRRHGLPYPSKLRELQGLPAVLADPCGSGPAGPVHVPGCINAA
jgi:hypothetical protein